MSSREQRNRKHTELLSTSFQELVRKDISAKFEAYSDTINAGIDRYKAALDVIVQVYKNRALEISRGDFEKTQKALKKELYDSRIQLVVVHYNKHQLIGKIVDVEL